MITHHPEFGELITRRRSSWPARLVVVPFAFMSALLALVAFDTWRATNAMRPGSGQVAMREDAMVTAIIAGVIGLLALVILWLVSRTVAFYSRGVVVRRLAIPVKRLDYRDLKTHVCKRTHVHRYGAYAGSHILLSLKTESGKSFRYRALHKQYMVGRGGPLKRQYQMVGHDRIDDASNCAAACIARKWLARIDAGESVDWTTYATLTPDGVAAWDGPCKGTIALYAELADMQIRADRGVLILQSGERFLSIPTSDPNFYPGFIAACEMRQRVSPELEMFDEET